jgi:hypothetical protein
MKGGVYLVKTELEILISLDFGEEEKLLKGR